MSTSSAAPAISSDLCLHCDYPLAGLAVPRCPHCGLWFDPADPATRNTTGRPLGEWRRRLFRLRAAPLIPGALLLFFAQLWLERFPVAPRLPHIRPLMMGWLLLIVAWLFLTVGVPFLTDASKLPRSQRPQRPRPDRAALWIAPLILLIALVASWRQWGFRAAFALSRPALDGFIAESQDAFPIMEWRPRPIGLFKPQSILTSRQLVVLQMPGNQALVYAPLDLDVPSLPEDTRRYFAPAGAVNWYLFDDRAAQPPAAQANWRAIQADAVCRDLFDSGDLRPQSMAFLLDALDRYTPQTPFAFHGLNYQAEPFGTLPGAIIAITRIGPSIVPDLRLALVAHKNAPLAYLGALGLLDAAAAPAAADIALFLKDPNPAVRETAVWALGRLGTGARPQVAALWVAFADPDADVQENARIAIRAIGPDLRGAAPGVILRWRKSIVDFDAAAAASSDAPDRAAPARQMLLALILAAGPDASSVAPDIGATIAESVEYLRKNPVPGSEAFTAPAAAGGSRPSASQAASQTLPAPGKILEWKLRVKAIADGTDMLASIGPFARDQSALMQRSLDTLIRERNRLRTDPAGAGMLMEPLAKALGKIDPQSAAVLSLLRNYVDQSRNGAVVEPADTSNDARDRPMYVDRLLFARLLQANDPQNVAIRAQLRRDLRAAVNAPERRWALDLTAAIPLPPEEIVPVIRQMITDGDARARDVAARAAARLGSAASPVAAGLIARIDAAVAPCDSVRAEIDALPLVDPDSPAAAECLLRALAKKSDAAPLAITRLRAAADAALPALLDAHPPGLLPLLAQMGPRARAAVPQLLNRLATVNTEGGPRLPAITDDDRRSILKIFAGIGPAAAPALPVILDLAQSASAPLAADALAALSAISTRGLSDDALNKLLADPRFRATLLRHGGHDARLLALLLEDPLPPSAAEAAMRANRISNLAAETPTPLEKLERFVPAMTTPDAIAALQKAQGPADKKLPLLAAKLTDARNPPVQIAAANALAALHPKDTFVRECLIKAAYTSNIQLVRTAAFAALDALFPSAREMAPAP